MLKHHTYYDLSEFIKEMTELVETTSEQVQLVSEAERLVGKLVDIKDWLDTKHIIAKGDHYARYPLYHDPEDRFEVIALVWQPGQSTPLHDHDGTWGVEGVFSGRIKVENYIQVGKPSNNRIKLYHSGSMTISENSTAQLLPPADCHILTAEGDQSTITIHVYGKQLQSFLVYDPFDGKNIYTMRQHRVSYTSKSV